MCKKCGDENHVRELEAPERRSMLLGAAGVAGATALAAGFSGSAAAATASASEGENAVSKEAFKTKAWAATDADFNFKAMEVTRRALEPNDVHIEIMYASICHSDIHTVKGDWGKPNYPVVPGHEMVGKVVAVGDNVTKFKVGDFAGVGCMVDSCGECVNCEDDREQNCLKGATFTYDSPDKVSGGVTYGGYSKDIVVTEHFAIRIPPGMDLSRAAPLLCAGITTFSPMQHWDLKRNQKVAIIGMGGLGHMAVKLAVARGAEVTVFTTTPSKIEDAKKMGAKQAILWSDSDAQAKLMGYFDLAITTVPESYNFQQFMNLLKLDATMVNVGALNDISGLNGMFVGFGRKSFAGSMIGGIAETQEVVDYCAARNILADVEMIKPDQIQKAYGGVMNKDVRYRYVIDMKDA